MAEEALRSLDAAVQRSASLLQSFDDVSPIGDASNPSEVRNKPVAPLHFASVDMRGFSDISCMPSEDLGNFLLSLAEASADRQRPQSARKPKMSTTSFASAVESPQIASARSAGGSTVRKIPTHFFRKFREAKTSFDFRNL